MSGTRFVATRWVCEPPDPQHLQYLVSSWRRRLVPASALPTVVDMSTDSEIEVSQVRGNRFALLGESQVGRDVGNRRRLVLISQRPDDVRDHEWDSDTESVGVRPMWKSVRSLNPQLRRTLLFWSEGTSEGFRKFGFVQSPMQSVPHVLEGAFKMALRVAFQEISDGTEANNEASRQGIPGHPGDSHRPIEETTNPKEGIE